MAGMEAAVASAVGQIGLLVEQTVAVTGLAEIVTDPI